MLIVGGTFEVDPDERDAFIAARLEGMVTSRAEAGCYEYVVSPDPVDPSRVVMYERWERQEDLDAHLTRVRAVPPREGAVTPRSIDIAVYDIAGERTLG